MKKVKEDSNKEEKSFAMELLEDYKKQNKRWFLAFTITLVMWFLTIVGILVYSSLPDYNSSQEALGENIHQNVGDK